MTIEMVSGLFQRAAGLASEEEESDVGVKNGTREPLHKSSDRCIVSRS